MPIIIGIDLGTTTITALAIDVMGGGVKSCRTVATPPPNTDEADAARGYREWDARSLVEAGLGCLRAVAQDLARNGWAAAGIGITGQQHGVVLVNDQHEPATPFINWQDRRGDEKFPGSTVSFAQAANDRLGEKAHRRLGCRLASGYMGVTLFWLHSQVMLGSRQRACFLADYFAACLTKQKPATDPTLAASAGLFDLTAGKWDYSAIRSLDLPSELFVDVRVSGEPLGGLCDKVAESTGLPRGLPVCVGIGDNQASFVGSVADRTQMALVNIGTGGQVAAFTDLPCHVNGLELRPFPLGGFLVVSAGLCGGAAFAILEQFFRSIVRDLLGAETPQRLFETMNKLAASVPPGADGLRCEPYFTGTRLDPALRASWTQVSASNWTAGHMTRAFLEGTARVLAESFESIRVASNQPIARIVGAGNGLRANSLLARILSNAIGLPLSMPVHHEEAAFGAALVASVGLGICSSLEQAGRCIQYQQVEK